METDLFSIVLGLSCLAIFMAPIFIYQISLKRDEKKLLKLLEATAADNKLNMDDKELFRTGFAVGLDQKMNTLIWVHRHSDTEVRKKVIQLEPFEKCSVYKSQTRSNEREGIIHNEIGISLKSNKKNKTENIPICSAEQGRLAGDEEIVASKWKNKIQKCLDA